MSQIDWAQVYDPRIHVGATQFQLPQPVLQWDEKFTLDFKRTKVPLRDGVTLTGITRGALIVTLSGLISKNTRSGVLHAKQRMQDLLINNGGTTFTFYKYYDTVRDNYRYYSGCICKDLSFSPVHNQVFTMAYSFSVVVPGGIESELITTTGEGPSADASGNLSGYANSSGFLGDDDEEVAAQTTALPADRTLLYGPVTIKLADAAGGSSFLIMNSDGNYVFRVDSDGYVRTTLPIAKVDSISWP